MIVVLVVAGLCLLLVLRWLGRRRAQSVASYSLAELLGEHKPYKGQRWNDGRGRWL